MTADQFKDFWNSAYSETIPIPHFFKHDYIDRWFRIHSLPESKRYADNEAEWEILINRQNKIITELLGNNSKVLLVTGYYLWEGNTEIYPLTDVKSISNFSFVTLDSIDLHKISSDEYDQGNLFVPIISELIWQPNKQGDLLKDMANDQVRAFFISEKNKCIVAPYDGGIDFILKDTETRNAYKEKYKDWLSSTENGW